MMKGDGIGGQSGIDHELPNPVALGLLLAEQKSLGPLDGGFQGTLGWSGRGCLTWRVP